MTTLAFHNSTMQRLLNYLYPPPPAEHPSQPRVRVYMGVKIVGEGELPDHDIALTLHRTMRENMRRRNESDAPIDASKPIEKCPT